MKIIYQSPQCCLAEAALLWLLLQASNEEYIVDPVDPGFNF